MICEFSFRINDKSLTGRKPPEDIRVRAKFSESNVLIENKFNNINIRIVSEEYNMNILVVCLKLSELLNDVKLVNVFLKLSS